MKRALFKRGVGRLGWRRASAFPLSRELALLAACDLADDEALIAHLGRCGDPAFDWSRFARLARGNDMAGLVAARLGALAADAVPAEVLSELAGFAQSNAVLQLAQTAVAADLAARLAQRGIACLVLKGVALAHQLYAPDPHWRSSSDIDLLIAAADLDAADDVLCRAGYVRKWPEHGLPAQGRSMFRLLANVSEYVSPGSGQLVELHHRITLNPRWMPQDFAALEAGAATIATARGAVRGLQGAPLVAYLCWHAFAHMGFRMKWLCDVVRALRHADAQSCAALCPASDGYARGPLELADVLIDAILPAALGTAAKPPRASRWLSQARRILADMEDPTDVPTRRTLKLLPQEIGFRLFLARLSPGRRGKGYEMLRALSDPRDVSVLGLDSRWVAIYALCGPFLAAWRFLRGRGGETPHLH